MNVVEVRQTDEFRHWLHRLGDGRAKARIVSRIRRMESGNPGDTRSLGSALREMRIDYGPGCRIYFFYRGKSLVILLASGDKRTQARDVPRARELMEELKR
jgi:putative addiction module killer protein